MLLWRLLSQNLAYNAYRQSPSPPQLAAYGLKLHAVLRLPALPRQTLRRTLTSSGIKGQVKDESVVRGPEFTLPRATPEPTATHIDPGSLTTVPYNPPIESTLTKPKSPTQLTTLPWYLRQQALTPVHDQELAQIPDLPPNPPPLLETLLEYLSITAGLEDLNLLDLRQIDPPPALGPKLIMIFSTARSEKHLHVAADRFCRYLRREHNLAANAAGLLGRNELKIKLRRRVKRMRMLANVGGPTPDGNIDDGIRTGWICCTISKIAAHPFDTSIPGDDFQDFVGFRNIQPGVNIVVQMFTEEKRAETDLESLWSGVLKTHQRDNKRADEALKGLKEEVEKNREDCMISGRYRCVCEGYPTPNTMPSSAVFWQNIMK